MAIVSDVPFKLMAVHYHPRYCEQSGNLFFSDENECWESDEYTLSIEENEEISILFDSDDPKSKLYMSALDVLPENDGNTLEDDEGHLYRKPSDTPFYLYKSEDNYDQLRVDVFIIHIVSNGISYYGNLRILPKQLTVKEWSMMRDDIENEIRGLSMDIVSKRIGLGGQGLKSFSPEVVYGFVVIEKYFNSVLMSLTDISENPRLEINTYYEKKHDKGELIQKSDSETIRRYMIRSGSMPYVYIPEKQAEYDIPENRLLKKIVNEYEDRVSQFISLIDEIEAFSIDNSIHNQVSNISDFLSDFKKKAIKIKRITGIIRSKEWYSKVGDYTSAYIPHAFLMDARYNVMYQLYSELKRDNLKIDADSEYTYSWKSSSILYEMWCLFKICRLLLQSFDIKEEDWKISLEGSLLFPRVQPGSVISFKNDKLSIDLIYDQTIPLGNATSSLDSPLYMAVVSDGRKHNRPDILLNVYNAEKTVYCGSIIFECKYRKIRSFWSNGNGSSCSQLQSYYNNARSRILLKGIGSEMDIRPVSKVVALTPDGYDASGIGEDFNIQIKEFKPDITKNIYQPISKLLDTELKKLCSRYEKLVMDN